MLTKRPFYGSAPHATHTIENGAHFGPHFLWWRWWLPNRLAKYQQKGILAVRDLGCCPQSCPQIQVTRLLTLFAIFGSILPENHECSPGTRGDPLSGPRKWFGDLLGPVGRHHGGNLHLEMHLQCICMHALWTFEWIRISQLPSAPGASICWQPSACAEHLPASARNGSGSPTTISLRWDQWGPHMWSGDQCGPHKWSTTRQGQLEWSGVASSDPRTAVSP